MVSSGKQSNRLPITPSTMRRLLLHSGGYCAMTGCSTALISSSSGGWIGTVAHIVGAEENGPRGKSPLTAQERRSFDNLILMCANHGREVDDAEHGEKLFPVPLLQKMKAAHEAKVGEVLTAAIEQESPGWQSAGGLLDTGRRATASAVSAFGLLESMGLTKDSVEAESVTGWLAETSQSLASLSQPALEALSSVLALWEIDCSSGRRDYSVAGKPNFGDPTGGRVEVEQAALRNRLAKNDSGEIWLLLQELVDHKLMHFPEEREEAYTVRSPWTFPVTPGARTATSWNFWIAAATFLHEGLNQPLSDWVPTLDFSVFDELAPETQTVQWPRWG